VHALKLCVMEGEEQQPPTHAAGGARTSPAPWPAEAAPSCSVRQPHPSVFQTGAAQPGDA